jgi:hypothetical protein
MILEEIDGEVVVTIIRENGQTTALQIGDYFSDHESGTLIVTGSGKAMIRVDPNCTFEVKGTVAETLEQPVVMAEQLTLAVEEPAPVVETAEETSKKK